MQPMVECGCGGSEFSSVLEKAEMILGYIQNKICSILESLFGTVWMYYIQNC